MYKHDSIFTNQLIHSLSEIGKTSSEVGLDTAHAFITAAKLLLAHDRPVEALNLASGASPANGMWEQNNQAKIAAEIVEIAATVIERKILEIPETIKAVNLLADEACCFSRLFQETNFYDFQDGEVNAARLWHKHAEALLNSDYEAGKKCLDHVIQLERTSGSRLCHYAHNLSEQSYAPA